MEMLSRNFNVQGKSGSHIVVRAGDISPLVSGGSVSDENCQEERGNKGPVTASGGSAAGVCKTLA